MTELEQRYLAADAKKLGDFGERVWKNIMLGAGVDLIPLHELAIHNGKGPRQLGSDLVLPDFDATSSRRRFYIDAKCKKHRAVFRNAGNERRHDIDRKYWEAYSTLSAKNVQKALLGIVELFGDQGTTEWSGRILAQTLWKLGQPIAQYGRQSREFKDMVFWPCDRFVTLAYRIDPEELKRMGAEPVTWRADIADVLKTLVALPTPIQQRLEF